MGNNPQTANKSVPGPSWNLVNPHQQLNACFDDLVCQNIDSKRSTPSNLVLVCPGAKCDGGTCKCGPNCERDPYTGICCSKVEKQVVQVPSGEIDMFGKPVVRTDTYTYCIENANSLNTNNNTKKPAPPTAPPTANVCKVPDQWINGIKIKGSKICDVYKQYNK